MGKIYVEQAAADKDGLLKLEIEKVAIVQLAILEVKLEQKWIGGIEVNAQNFAVFEFDLLKGDFRNLAIAQIAGVKGAVFEG
ncbi:hypothetical protein [Algoriphagus hitonicola]